MESMDTGQRMRGSSRRRRSMNFLIKPAFQWKYTVATIVLVFLVSLIVSSQAYGILYQQARSKALYQSSVTTGEVVSSLVLSAVVLAAIPAIGLGLWSIVVTHRICGPVTVLQNYLTELIHGRFPVRRPLRKRDEFKDFYDVFWRAVDNMKASKRSDLNMMAEIRDLASTAVRADDKTRVSALEKIKEHSEAFCSDAARVLGVEDVQAPSPPKPRKQLSPASV